MWRGSVGLMPGSSLHSRKQDGLVDTRVIELVIVRGCWTLAFVAKKQKGQRHLSILAVGRLEANLSIVFCERDAV